MERIGSIGMLVAVRTYRDWGKNCKLIEGKESKPMLSYSHNHNAESELEEQNNGRHNNYGVRRARPIRRRKTKSIKIKGTVFPGGIRQRRNKHWNW